MKIKHEDKKVEQWVNAAIAHADRQLGPAVALVTKDVREGLAARHLIAVFAAQEVVNGARFVTACDALMAAFAQS